MTIKSQTEADMETIARHSSDDALAVARALDCLGREASTEQLFAAKERAEAYCWPDAMDELDQLLDQRLSVDLKLTESELEVLFGAINSIPGIAFGGEPDPRNPRATVEQKITALRSEVHRARS